MWDDLKTEVLDLNEIYGSLDEDVKLKIKKKNKNFNNFHVKYKKDKKKYIVLILILLSLIASLGGASFAYLTHIAKTENDITIKAGTLALTINNEENSISMINAVPTSDVDGLSSNNEYTFSIKNEGSITAKYKIVLANTCKEETVGDVTIDKCVPNNYIRVGLKQGNSEYKTLESTGDELVLDSGELLKEESKNYKMKLWLSYDTPNDYNSKGGKNILYQGKINIFYEQTN